MITKRKLSEKLDIPFTDFIFVVNEILIVELQNLGYAKNQKQLTPKQQEVIQKYFE